MRFDKAFKLKLPGKLIISLVFGLYVFTGLYYTLVKKHTLQEWIALSTNPQRIVNKIKSLIVQADINEFETYREWNRLGEWSRFSDNPILKPGPSRLWDGGIATFASVIKDSNEFKMYYSGRDGNYTNGQIGLAISNDGKKWEKYSGNPILRIGPFGSWDEAMIWCPMVWKEQNTKLDEQIVKLPYIFNLNPA